MELLAVMDVMVKRMVMLAKVHFSQVVKKAVDGEQMAADLQDKLGALWEGSEDKFEADVRVIFTTLQDKPRQEGEAHARGTDSKCHHAGWRDVGHVMNKFRNLDYAGHLGRYNSPLNCFDTAQHMAELSTIFFPTPRMPEENSFYNFQTTPNFFRTLTLHRPLRKDSARCWDFDVGVAGKCVHTIPTVNMKPDCCGQSTGDEGETKEDTHLADSAHLADVTDGGLAEKAEKEGLEKLVAMATQVRETLTVPDLHADPDPLPVAVKVKARKRQKQKRQVTCLKTGRGKWMRNVSQKSAGAGCIPADHPVSDGVGLDLKFAAGKTQTADNKAIDQGDTNTDSSPLPCSPLPLHAVKAQSADNTDVDQGDTSAVGSHRLPPLHADKAQNADNKVVDQEDTSTDGSHQLPPLHTVKAQTTNNSTVNQMDASADGHQVPCSLLHAVMEKGVTAVMEANWRSQSGRPARRLRDQGSMKKHLQPSVMTIFKPPLPVVTDTHHCFWLDKTDDGGLCMLGGHRLSAGCWDDLLKRADVRCFPIKVKAASNTSGGGNTGGQHGSSFGQSGGGGGGSSQEWRGGARPKSLYSGDGGDDDDDEKRRLPPKFMSVAGVNAGSEARDKGQTTTPPRNYKRHRKKQHGAISNEQMCHCLGQAGMGIEMLRQSSGAGEMDHCVARCLHDTSTVTSPTVEDLQCCCCAVLHSLLSHFASATHPSTCPPCRQLVSLIHFHVLMCPDTGLPGEEGDGGFNVCHKMQVAKLFDESTVTPDSSRVWMKIQKYLSAALGSILLVDCCVDVGLGDMEDWREDTETLTGNTTTTYNNGHGPDAATALYSPSGVVPGPDFTISTSASATHSPAPSISTPLAHTPAVATPATCTAHTPGMQTAAIVPKSTLTRRHSRRSLSIKTIPEEPTSLPPSSLPTPSLHSQSQPATEPQLVDSVKGAMEDPFSGPFFQVPSPSTLSGGEDIMKYIQDFAAKNPEQGVRRPSRPSPNPYDTQKIYGARDGTILSMPEPRARPLVYPEPLLSVEFKAKGVPGIGEVVYGTRKKLLEVVRSWRIERDECRAAGRCRYQHHEEGVILAPFKQQLRILHTRYQKHQQWERLVHLGNGVTGKCHLCIDRTSNFKFCCKKVHILSYEDQELDIWSELSHPNVVCFYGAIRHGERIYMFAQFIDGGSLAVLIKEQWAVGRRLSHWMALNYFRQILVTLTYLQSKGILHEDIKADNLLLQESTTEIILADFGVAQRICHDHAPRGRSPTGSPAHWSPEKASSEGHGFPSDLWAAACVLIHMLSGSPPWISRFPDAAILNFLIWSKPAPVDDIPQNVRESMRDLIACCLVKDVAIRPSAKQVLQHLAFQMLDQSGSLYSTFLPQLPGHEVSGVSVPGHEVSGASAVSEQPPEQGAVGGVTVTEAMSTTDSVFFSTASVQLVHEAPPLTCFRSQSGVRPATLTQQRAPLTQTPCTQRVFFHDHGNYTSGLASLPVISTLPDNAEQARTVRTRSTGSAPTSLQDRAAILFDCTSPASVSIPSPAVLQSAVTSATTVVQVSTCSQYGRVNVTAAATVTTAAGNNTGKAGRITTTPPTPLNLPLTHREQAEDGVSTGHQQDGGGLEPYGAGSDTSSFPSATECPVLVYPDIQPYAVPLTTRKPTHTSTSSSGCQQAVAILPTPEGAQSVASTQCSSPRVSVSPHSADATTTAISSGPHQLTLTRIQADDVLARTYPLYPDLSPEDFQLSVQRPALSIIPEMHEGESFSASWPTSTSVESEDLHAWQYYHDQLGATPMDQGDITHFSPHSQGRPLLQLYDPDTAATSVPACGDRGQQPAPASLPKLEELLASTSDSTATLYFQYKIPSSSEEEKTLSSGQAWPHVVHNSRQGEQLHPPDCTLTRPSEFISPGLSEVTAPRSSDFTPPQPAHDVPDFLQPLTQKSHPTCDCAVTGADEEQISSGDLFGSGPEHCVEFCTVAEHRECTINVQSANINTGHGAHSQDQLSPMSVVSGPVSPSLTRRNPNLRLDVTMSTDHSHHPASRVTDSRTRDEGSGGQRGRVIFGPRPLDTHPTPHTQPTASSDGSFPWHAGPMPQDVSPLTPAPSFTSKASSSQRPGSGSSTPHSTYDRQEQEWHNLLQENGTLGDFPPYIEAGEPALLSDTVSSMHHLSLNYQTVPPMVNQEESSMLSVLQDQIQPEGQRMEFLNHQGELLFDMRIRPCNRQWSELVGSFAPQIRVAGLRHYWLLHPDSGMPIDYFAPIEHTLMAVKVVEVSEDKFELCWCEIHQIHSA